MTVSIRVDWEDDAQFTHEHSDITADVDSLSFLSGQTGDILRAASGACDIDNEPQVWIPSAGRLTDAQYLLWHYLRVEIHGQQMLICRARFGRRNTDGRVNVLRMHLDTQNSTSLSNQISVDTTVGSDFSGFWPPPGLTSKVASADRDAFIILVGSPVSFSGSEARYLTLLSQLLGGLFLDGGKDRIEFFRWADISQGATDVKLSAENVSIRGAPVWIPIDDFLTNTQTLQSTALAAPVSQSVAASVARWGARERLLPPWVSRDTGTHTRLLSDLTVLSEPMRTVVLDCELTADSMTVMRQIGVGTKADVDIDGTGRRALCMQTQLRLSRAQLPVLRCWFVSPPSASKPTEVSPPAFPRGVFRNPFPPPPVTLTAPPKGNQGVFSGAYQYLDYRYVNHSRLGNRAIQQFRGTFPADAGTADDDGDVTLMVIHASPRSDGRAPWSFATDLTNSWPAARAIDIQHYVTGRERLNAEVLVSNNERDRDFLPTGDVLDWSFHTGRPLPYDVQMSGSVTGRVINVSITADITEHTTGISTSLSDDLRYEAVPENTRWSMIAWKLTGYDTADPYRDVRAAAPLSVLIGFSLPTDTVIPFTAPEPGLWVIGTYITRETGFFRPWGSTGQGGTANNPAFVVL